MKTEIIRIQTYGKERIMESPLKSRLLKKTAAQVVLLSSLPLYMAVVYTIYCNQVPSRSLVQASQGAALDITSPGSIPDLASQSAVSASQGAALSSQTGLSPYAALVAILGGILFAVLFLWILILPAWRILTGSRYRGMEAVERYFSDKELELQLSGQRFTHIADGLLESEKWLCLTGVFFPKNMIANWDYIGARFPRDPAGEESIELLLTDGGLFTIKSSRPHLPAVYEKELRRRVRPLHPELSPARLLRLPHDERKTLRRQLKADFLITLRADRAFLFDAPLTLPAQTASNFTAA